MWRSAGSTIVRPSPEIATAWPTPCVFSFQSVSLLTGSSSPGVSWSPLDATELLMARGEAPSVSAVATAAGVSRPTVYAHFPEREQLVEAVVERTVSRIAIAIASAEPQDGAALDALRRLVRAGWVELGRHGAIGQSAARELSSDAMHRSHHAALATLHQLLERGRGDGAFRTDLPPRLLVMGALALIHTTADAVRQGVLVADEAGAAVERLIVEMWRRA
jgi:AcrR family transcriptional regulator